MTEEPDEDFEEGDDLGHGMVGEAVVRVAGCGEEVEAGLGCEHDGAEVRERVIGMGESTGVDEEAGEVSVRGIWEEEGADDVGVGDIAVDEAEGEACLQLV